MKKSKKLILSLTAVLLLVTGCGKVPKLQNGQEAVVTLKDGEAISVDELYQEMKDQYALSVLLDMVDNQLLSKIYPTDDEEKEYLDSQVEQFSYYYEAYYSTMYDSFENFLYSQYGVKDEKELRSVLSLNHKRSKAAKDYAKDQLEPDEIKKYYDEKIIGKMKASHILIKADYESGASEEEIEKAKNEAYKKANNIIKELNEAKKEDIEEKFAELAKKYSEDGSADNGGDLDWFEGGDMVAAFEKATIKLKVGEYSSTPVETEFGYHIILKTGEKEKEELDAVKDKILEALAEEKINEDNKLQMKSLIELRKKHGIEIQDKDLKRQYKKYIENTEEE